VKTTIRVGKTAAHRKSVRIRIGLRPAKHGHVVYERTTCCWSIRQTAAQIRK